MRVSIEKQPHGMYIAYNATNGKVRVIGVGETAKEAKEDFMNTVKEIKEHYAAFGEEMPEYLSEVMDFCFDI